jgi:hypothetical protein
MHSKINGVLNKLKKIKAKVYHKFYENNPVI